MRIRLPRLFRRVEEEGPRRLPPRIPDPGERRGGGYPVGPYYVEIRDGKYLVWDVPMTEEELRDAALRIERHMARVYETVEEALEGASPAVRRVFEREVWSSRGPAPGYSILEPLIMDDGVIDVFITYQRGDREAIVSVVHKDHGYLTCNIRPPARWVDRFLEKAATANGKSVNRSRPYASFIDLRTGHRISGMIATEVSVYGGVLVIRKQPKRGWSLVTQILAGTLTPEEAGILAAAVKAKVAILVLGEMMSGKTTMISALGTAIPPWARVVTIEDTPEIMLPVPFWRRTASRETATEWGMVTYFDLVKLALRLSADYVIVGEIRGEEARAWAQAVMLGHGGLTSFHAAGVEEAAERLRQPPISVAPEAVRAIRLAVLMRPVRSEGRLRRVAELYTFPDGKPLFVEKGGKPTPVGDPIKTLEKAGILSAMALRPEIGDPLEEIKNMTEKLRRLAEEGIDDQAEVNRALYS